MKISELLKHIESGECAFNANKVTRYVQGVVEGDTRMICYKTTPAGKPKYVRLTDFAMWADKPGISKRKGR